MGAVRAHCRCAWQPATGGRSAEAREGKYRDRAASEDVTNATPPADGRQSRRRGFRRKPIRPERVAVRPTRRDAHSATTTDGVRQVRVSDEDGPSAVRDRQAERRGSDRCRGDERARRVGPQRAGGVTEQLVPVTSRDPDRRAVGRHRHAHRGARRRRGGDHRRRGIPIARATSITFSTTALRADRRTPGLAHLVQPPPVFRRDDPERAGADSNRTEIRTGPNPRRRSNTATTPAASSVTKAYLESGETAISAAPGPEPATRTGAASEPSTTPLAPSPLAPAVAADRIQHHRATARRGQHVPAVRGDANAARVCRYRNRPEQARPNADPRDHGDPGRPALQRDECEPTVGRRRDPVWHSGEPHDRRAHRSHNPSIDGCRAAADGRTRLRRTAAPIPPFLATDALEPSPQPATSSPTATAAATIRYAIARILPARHATVLSCHR